MIPAVAFRFKQLDLMPHHHPALGHLLPALQIPVPRRLPVGDSKTPEGEDVTTHFYTRCLFHWHYHHEFSARTANHIDRLQLQNLRWFHYKWLVTVQIAALDPARASMNVL